MRASSLLFALTLLSAACGGESPGPIITRPDTGSGAKDATVVPTDSGEVDVGGAEDSGQGTTCDANPAGCEAGRLRGPAPACQCLSGCESGFTWNGTGCTPTGGTDAAVAMDAEPAPDAIVVGMDADPAPDAVVVGMDAAPAPDAVVVNPDATAPDAVVFPDATVFPDAAVLPDAAGVSDTGVSDTGVRDAGVADTGVRDAGAPDSGFVPSGLFEGDPCTPTGPNTCLREPGMVCQSLDAPTNSLGICLKTCNAAQNTNGTRNAACTGIGPNCVDLFNQGAANSRCLNAQGPFEALDETVLDVCDPTAANLEVIDRGATHPRGAGPGVCWPLCTVTPSPTQPVNVSCAAGSVCISDPGATFRDAANNVFGTCGTRVPRDGACEAADGRFCGAGDLCVLGVCRQRFGTTCTATTACPAGQACAADGVAPNRVAFCNEGCSVLGANTCGAGQACTLATLNNQPTGICRSRTATVAAGGDCSDVLDLGSNANDCAAGTICLPSDATGDFAVAECFALCNPAMASCPSTTPQCTAFGAPFQSFGVCF